MFHVSNRSSNIFALIEFLFNKKKWKCGNIDFDLLRIEQPSVQQQNNQLAIIIHNRVVQICMGNNIVDVKTGMRRKSREDMQQKILNYNFYVAAFFLHDAPISIYHSYMSVTALKESFLIWPSFSLTFFLFYILVVNRFV